MITMDEGLLPPAQRWKHELRTCPDNEHKSKAKLCDMRIMR